MDFFRNEDKLDDSTGSLSFNQILDVSIDEDISASQELFTVGQFKQHYGKIDTSDEDTLITALIPAARQMCERYVGMLFIAREVIATVNNLNGGVYLPYGPIGTITDVNDINGNEITDYKITGTVFKQMQWPTYDLMAITYAGGYTTCPEQLITAVKEQTLWLYDNRGKEGVGMAPNAQMILNPLKRPI